MPAGGARPGVSAKFCLAFSTFPDSETARQVAGTLIGETFAACANIISGVESIYFWKGKIENGSEALVIFKLTLSRYGEFEARLRKLHPYEVPEIIRVEIAEGNRDYLNWVDECCSRHERGA